MAEEKTKQETIRLPLSTIETAERLAKHGIMGKAKAEVFKNLIRYAIDHLVEQDFVKKSIETKRLLRTEPE